MLRVALFINNFGQVVAYFRFTITTFPKCQVILTP